MTITAALIVKDEEKHLRRCLESLNGVVDEIVVADTGSVDATIEIAREFTQAVHEIPWTDDFAAARNAALEFVTGDYVLQIDADETVIDGASARDRLEAFIEKYPDGTIGTVDIRSTLMVGDEPQEASDPVYRFFKHGLFMYEGAIHEQVAPIVGDKAEAPTGVIFTHSGYDVSQVDSKAKQGRNRRILFKVLEGDPENGYYKYQLGKSYYGSEDFSSSAQAFEEALEVIKFSGTNVLWKDGTAVAPEVLLNLLASLAYAYVNTDRLDSAKGLLETHQSLNHCALAFADFHYALGYVYLVSGDLPNAQQCYEAAIALGADTESILGTGSYACYYHLGLVHEGAQDLEGALRAYLRSIEIKPDYGVTLSRWIDLITEYGLILPKQLWEACDHDAFTSRFIKRLSTYNTQGDEKKIGLLFRSAQNLDPALAQTCAQALKRPSM